MVVQNKLPGFAKYISEKMDKHDGKPRQDNLNKSSRPEVFYRKGVNKKFAIFTEKHMCRSVFFNNAAGLALFSCKF